MEADDEWEDHLIVSYTPQRGSEMTMTEHQVERIIANTKLEMALVVGKPSQSTEDESSYTEAAKKKIPTDILEQINSLASHSVLKQKHKYWNFICRNRRVKNSLIAAVGSHVFHQTQTGEWQMFDEPGDSKYSGDIRFVLQWKQYDFVFTNFAPVTVYQEGKFVKNLEHKYSGNSSFGVKASANAVYFMDNDKLRKFNSELVSFDEHPASWASNGELINFDVSSSGSLLVLFTKKILHLTKFKGDIVQFQHDQDILGGSLRYLSSHRVFGVFKSDGSTNQAVLMDYKLSILTTLDLAGVTETMNKMRLIIEPSGIRLAVLNQSTAILVLAIAGSKIYKIGSQDSKEDIYTFAYLGKGVLITGGFNRLFCHKITTSTANKLKSI